LTLAYQRKVATFSITAKKGSLFLKKEVIVGTASVPLGGLLENLEVGGTVGIARENDKGKLKEVPGAITVKLLLRSPVLGPCVSVSEERVLQVDPWPPVVAAVAAATPSPPPPLATPSPAKSATATTPVPSPAKWATATTPISATESNDSFADVSEREKKDPLMVDCLVSNDVLDDELARCQAEVAKCQDEGAKIFLVIRVQIVQTKLAILVTSVQEEKISLAEYLDMIKDRIAKDQRLLLYLKHEFKKLNAQPTKDMEELHELVKNVRSVENRLTIMQNEVKGAEEA
jgi:hypothetical protein